MNIVIASGKGGTGKTTLALNLARMIDTDVQLLDCDVEEPNDHLFFDVELQKQEDVNILIPQIDVTRCDQCGECSEICQFNAIAMLEDRPLLFPELCHGCGGCTMICPRNAISEIKKQVGIIENLTSGNIHLIQGRLDIGSMMAPTVIRAVKANLNGNMISILDAPPGTACPVVATIKDTDFVVLVTEPTPFGLHDLVLAVNMVQALGVPFAVVINRAGIGDDDVKSFCDEANIPVLIEIPDDRRIAEAYSRGELIIDALPEYKNLFQTLYNKILEQIQA
ncbi:MAG: ATP-binding protein [Gammaproteobacteria bacterium]|nr:ATP-binding protein [Gammaproteobacteria bacterium]